MTFLFVSEENTSENAGEDRTGPREDDGDLSSRETEDAIADRIRSRRARTEKVGEDRATNDVSEEEDSEQDRSSPPRARARQGGGTASRRPRTTTARGRNKSRIRTNKATGKKKKKKDKIEKWCTMT